MVLLLVEAVKIQEVPGNRHSGPRVGLRLEAQPAQEETLDGLGQTGLQEGGGGWVRQGGRAWGTPCHGRSRWCLHPGDQTIAWGSSRTMRSRRLAGNMVDLGGGWREMIVGQVWTCNGRENRQKKENSWRQVVQHFSVFLKSFEFVCSCFIQDLCKSYDIMTQYKVFAGKSAKDIAPTNAPGLCISCSCLLLPGHTSFSLVLSLHVAYVQEIYCPHIHAKLLACYSWL